MVKDGILLEKPLDIYSHFDRFDRTDKKENHYFVNESAWGVFSKAKSFFYIIWNNNQSVLKIFSHFYYIIHVNIRKSI